MVIQCQPNTHRKVKKMIQITDRQKKELKSILDEKEYEGLLLDDIADFFTDLHLLIVGYMDTDYNATTESDELQRLYDEIYKQNENL